MAKLCDITLADKNSSFDSGAAFLLAQKCKVSRSIQVDLDWEVEVQNDCPYIIARSKGATDPLEIFEIAHEKAQQGLDLFSAQNSIHLSIRDSSEEYLVWWCENGIQVLRVVFTTNLNVNVPPVKVTVTDQSGNVIPDPVQPSPIYHPALRYFRLAQVTDDLFDAYRNMWLAFELLLSWKYPKSKEREKDWLKRSLNLTNNSLSLPKVFTSTGSDIVTQIIDNLYQDARLPLFHAKDSKPYLVPHDFDARIAVRDALKKLTRIMIFLIEKWLNLRYTRGGMTNIAFDMGAIPLLTDSEIVLLGSDIPLGTEESFADFKNILFKTFITRHAPEYSQPGLQYVLGNISSTELNGIERVKRFVLKKLNADDIIVWTTLESNLNCEGLDRLDALIGIRLNNIREPKTFHKA